MTVQPTTGRAALVANNLPTSKSVSAATNATPIVVTTTTAHGLQVNEIFQITGVTGNANANGVFIAGAVTSNTVTLLAYPGGTNVAGSGAYVSGGTLQSLGFGVTVPVPNDVTEMMRAGSVNVPHEAALDRLAWLLMQALRSVNGLSIGVSGLETFMNQPWFIGAGTVAIGSGAFSSINAGDTGSMLLPLPHGATLSELRLRLAPAVHAALPGTMPSYTLYVVDGLTGTNFYTQTATDPSGSTVAYNAAHYVTMTLTTPQVIDRQSYVYLVVFTQESGANSAAGNIGQTVVALR